MNLSNGITPGFRSYFHGSITTLLLALLSDLYKVKKLGLKVPSGYVTSCFECRNSKHDKGELEDS